MSGHSKWAQIKHKKAVVDSKRSKLFSQLSRAITLAVQEKGTDPALNSSLRTAIERAQEMNMSKDTIERAIHKASAEERVMRVLYEAYGPGGVAIIIEGITTNNNRTCAELRKILEDNKAKMAPGGALWAFIKQQDGWIPSAKTPANAATQKDIETLREALEEHDDIERVYTNMTRTD